MLRAAYAEYFSSGDGCTKSSDGYIGIKYPPHWHDGWERDEATGIEIYSYSLGPSRMHEWHKSDKPEEVARSDYRFKYCADPFAQALADVKEWQRELRVDIAND